MQKHGRRFKEQMSWLSYIGEATRALAQCNSSSSNMERWKNSLALLVIAVIICANWGLAMERERSKTETEGLCAQLVRPLGYPCFEYTVATKDGFLLGVQRVPYGSHGRDVISVEPRSPIFLQHGLFQVRGTRWSHGHVSLSEHSKAFWDWSWEELAGRDLPDMIEFVHSATGSKVYYVGHSQGTIMAFAAFTQPVVVNMIAAAALLCPISYLDHITSRFARRAVNMHLDQMMISMGMHHINFRSDMAVQLADFVCADEDMNCGDLLTSITGPNCCFNSSRVDFYLKYEPHPSSTKNIKHLFQSMHANPSPILN